MALSMGQIKELDERSVALCEALKADGVTALSTIQQAAKVLGASEQGVRRAINENKLLALDAQCAPAKGAKRGRRIWRIARRDLADFLVYGGAKARILKEAADE